MIINYVTGVIESQQYDNVNSKQIPYHNRLASKSFNFFSEISVCLKQHVLDNNNEIFI